MAASWRGTTKGGGRYIVAREAGTGSLMSRGRGRLSFACRCNEPPFLLQKSKALRKNDKFLSLTTVSCTSLALLRVVRDKPHTAFANRWNGWKIIVSLDPFDFFLSTGLFQEEIEADIKCCCKIYCIRVSRRESIIKSV